MIGLAINIVGFVILMIAGFRAKTWLFLLGAVVFTGGFVVGYIGGAQVRQIVSSIRWSGNLRWP